MPARPTTSVSDSHHLAKASLRKVAEVGDVTFWQCPEGHIWEEITCAPYWASDTYPRNDGYIFERRFESAPRVQFWTERRSKRQQRLMREVDKYVAEGWRLAAPGTTMLQLAKTTVRRGLFGTREERRTCMLSVDAWCRIFGEYEDTGERWGEGAGGPWYTGDHCRL